MKRYNFLVIILFSLNLNVFSQVINTPKITGMPEVTKQQALNEFYSLHQYLNSQSKWVKTPSLLENNYSIPIRGGEIFWNPSDNVFIRVSADALRSYAMVFRYEVDQTRKADYLEIINGLSRYLITIQNITNDGGFNESLKPFGNFNTVDHEISTTYRCASALYESYLSTGNVDYLNAANKSFSLLYLRPVYPFLYDFSNFSQHEYTFYSNAGYLGRAADNLSIYYSYSNDNNFLDRSISTAEELIAWQNFLDPRDIWIDPLKGVDKWNDGGWYWYCYDTNTPPSGTPINPFSGGFDQGRRVPYNIECLNGLSVLQNTIGQQSLLGIVTQRDNTDILVFRQKLRTSITNSLNFMIANQETQNVSIQQYRGLLYFYKNQKDYSGGALISKKYSTSIGLSAIVEAYVGLKYFTDISDSDLLKVKDLINSMANGMIGKKTSVWPISEWIPRSLLPSWAGYIKYISENKLGIDRSVILENGNFENTERKWELWSWDSQVPQLIIDPANSSNKIVKILDDSENHSKWASQLVSVSPSYNYTVTGLTKIVSGRQAIYIHYKDKDGNLIDWVSKSFSANSAWTPVSFKFVTPSNVKFIDIRLYSYWYEKSDGYWDNISLVKGEKSLPIDKISSPDSTIEMVDTPLNVYPNPFNGQTNIKFKSLENSVGDLKIFDILGREIITKSIDIHEGENVVQLELNSQPSGTYFIVTNIGQKRTISKILLMK